MNIMKIMRNEIDAMAMEEKLELSEVLWVSIRSSTDELPVPDWHKDLLDESLWRRDTHPDDYSTWPEVKARLNIEK